MGLPWGWNRDEKRHVIWLQQGYKEVQGRIQRGLQQGCEGDAIQLLQRYKGECSTAPPTETAQPPRTRLGSKLGWVGGTSPFPRSWDGAVIR